MPEPPILSTGEWGARAPNSDNFPKKAAAGLVIHNTEDPNRAPLSGEAEKRKASEVARAIQADHLKRGWADTGQHFLVSRGGLILEGRHGSLAAAKEGKVVRGAHANSRVHNTTWFGIELEGDNRAEFAVTDAQWSTLVGLCAWLSLWGEFDPRSIKGHMEVSSTDCPGKVMGRLDDLRGRVISRRAEIERGTR